MKRKALIGLLSLSLLVSGAAAWEFTGSIETNFGDYFEDASGPSNWACNEISAYFLPECTKPISIEVGGATTSEVKWSIANSAAVATDNREQILGSTEKRLNSSYGVAMAEAKQEGIEDLNAGASEAVATSNASDIVRDWYGKIQRNVINYANREALKVNSSIQEIEDTSGLSVSDVFYAYESEWDGSANWVLEPVQDMRVVERNQTLFNGEEMVAYTTQAKIKVGAYEDTHTYGWVNFSRNQNYNLTACHGVDCAVGYANGDREDHKQEAELLVSNPEGEKTRYSYGPDYDQTLRSISSTKDRAVSNVRTVIEDIFSTYQQGEVNVSSSLGPLEVLKTSSTSFDSTGLYDYATVTARQMGLNTDDTYAFKVEWSQEGSNTSQSDVGQLFLDEGDFNDTIEVGKQYNVTDETVWFTHTGSNGEPVQTVLNGTFTVTEMTDKSSGESIDSTSTQDISVYESNVTDLQNQLQELKELYEEAETESSGGTSGGGSWSPYQLGLAASLFLILALLLVIGGATLA